MIITADQFRDMFHVLHNIDKADLEAAGVITHGAVGGSDWSRFNSDIGTFVLKLRQENLEELFHLVRRRMPAGVHVDADGDEIISPYEWLAQEFERLAVLRKMWTPHEVAEIIRRHDIERKSAA